MHAPPTIPLRSGSIKLGLKSIYFVLRVNPISKQSMHFSNLTVYCRYPQACVLKYTVRATMRLCVCTHACMYWSNLHNEFWAISNSVYIYKWSFGKFSRRGVDGQKIVNRKLPLYIPDKLDKFPFHQNFLIQLVLNSFTSSGWFSGVYIVPNNWFYSLPVEYTSKGVD